MSALNASAKPRRARLGRILKRCARTREANSSTKRARACGAAARSSCSSPRSYRSRPISVMHPPVPVHRAVSLQGQSEKEVNPGDLDAARVQGARAAGRGTALLRAAREGEIEPEAPVARTLLEPGAQALAGGGRLSLLELRLAEHAPRLARPRLKRGRTPGVRLGGGPALRGRVALRGGDGAVAEQRVAREERHDDERGAGDEPLRGPRREAATGRPRGGEQGGAEEQRRERDAGQLPVPVEGRVQQERDVGTGRGGDERQLPRAH